MARKEIIQQILQTFKQLGGNVSDVLGSRTNVSFLGVGDSAEPFLDQRLNVDALGFLSQSKAIDEAKNAVGFAVSDKLNDIQANTLLMNLNKMKEFYMPGPGPANITDLGTGTKNLDAEGIMTLRRGGDPTKYKPGDPITSENFAASGFAPSDEVLKNLKSADDIPPPGSRGGPEDIAAPIQSADETIANLEKQDPILAAQMKKMMNEGIISTVGNKGNIPGKRASAREFLVEALKKDTMDVGTPAFGKTNLNDVISAEDVKFITEGGGGIGGDPIVLVEKYFGPRIAEALPVNASNEEIVIFTNRVLTSVEDAAGLKPDNPKFDRTTARFVDKFDYRADGGRVGYFSGKLVGKALGLSKKMANINKSVDEGTEMGYQALRKYGLEAEDITRLFKEIAMDRTLVGKEKTEYFKMLNQVLKNPDEFPDGIIEIKKRLGMDFARGGLAKILEV